MRYIACLVCAMFWGSTSVMAGPPTVGPEITYYLAPLDDEGYVDYVAALNAAFGDADAPPQDNAFLGILDQVDLSDWPEGHVPALYAALNADPPEPDHLRFVTFYDYAETQGLPSAPPFDWENAAPGEVPPPPPPGTIDAIAEQADAAPWTEDQFPVVAQWLDTVSAPLDAIIEATKRPAYYAPLVRPYSDATLYEVWLPHLGSHRGIARSLNTRIRWNLGRNELDAAIADWAALKRLARLQLREPAALSNLVGISIQAPSHDAFNLILSQPSFTVANATQMKIILNELPHSLQMTEVVQQAERAWVLDFLTQASRGRAQVLDTIRMMQSSSLDDQSITFFVTSEVPDPLTALVSDPRFDIERALRRINTAWDHWFGGVFMDYAKFTAKQKQVEAEIEQLAAQSRQNTPSLIALGQNGIPESANVSQIADATADLMLENLSSLLFIAITTERQSQAQAALEPVALALAAYRIDQGRYPPLLQSLIPEYLDAMPADPFGDKSLRYRSHADGYRLYSVGANLTDDGGVHDFREGDIVLAVPWSESE